MGSTVTVGYGWQMSESAGHALCPSTGASARLSMTIRPDAAGEAYIYQYGVDSETREGKSEGRVSQQCVTARKRDTDPLMMTDDTAQQ